MERQAERRKLKNIILGDVHGHFKNLRDFLIEHQIIDTDNNRINKDSIRVYSVGDLIDGGMNRDGDLLILDYAERWFDQVAIGNHEYGLIGGTSFSGMRVHDRETQFQILKLIRSGLYVPAFKVEDYLITHAGLSNSYQLQTVDDALKYINTMWKIAETDKHDVDVFDNDGKYGDKSRCGIFWLDWTQKRNTKINQIMGHSPIGKAPIVSELDDVTHYNLDCGGKFGFRLAGLSLKDGEAYALRWGEKFDEKEGNKLIFRPEDDRFGRAEKKELMWIDPNQIEEEEVSLSDIEIVEDGTIDYDSAPIF